MSITTHVLNDGTVYGMKVESIVKSLEYPVSAPGKIKLPKTQTPIKYHITLNSLLICDDTFGSTYFE